MEKEISGIVRLGEVDLNGNLPLNRGLLHIKGIGYSTASIVSEVIYRELGIEKGTPIGAFSEKEMQKTEEILENLNKYLPKFMLNRQGEYETGEGKHMIGASLSFSNRQDIERKKNSKAWQGMKHMYGKHKVRGQRTRNTGRTGLTVGVSRAKEMEKKKAAAVAARAAPGAKAAEAAPTAAPAKAAAPAKTPAVAKAEPAKK